MMRGKLAVATIAAASALASALCTPTSAADISRRPPPPPLMQPIYSWNGFYVGGHVGGAFASEDVTEDFVTFSTDPSGVLGGLQAGYNFQIAPYWLLGIEGELSWTSASATTFEFHSHHNWYDTLDGRLGYVMGPPAYIEQRDTIKSRADRNSRSCIIAASSNQNLDRRELATQVVVLAFDAHPC